MISEIVHEKTPNGGDYSEILYFNDNMQPVDSDIATIFIIHEYKKNGELIMETIGKKMN